MRTAKPRVPYAAAALVFALALAGGCRPEQGANVMTDPDQAAGGAGKAREDTPSDPAATTETATFAAGCFWGVEATFRKVPGVVDAAVGYSGGHLDNPTYQDVCTDKTGHAEAVRVIYDPSKVSYDDLLEVFWNCHDPTTPNRQGPDVGTQYRSAVFFHSPEQEAAAKASKQRLQASGPYKGRTVVTEITPAATFWRAEEYHQRYLEKQGKDTCQTH
jgi:peptide-methionine (S)-S-oxide reductase